MDLLIEVVKSEFSILTEGGSESPTAAADAGRKYLSSLRVVLFSVTGFRAYYS